MSRHTITVIELRHHEMAYTVEADSREEAVDKALRGDTVEETEVRDRGVVDRELA